MRNFTNRYLLAGLAALALAVVGGFAWSIAPRAEAGPNCDITDSYDGEEQAFLAQINLYRQQNGLGPLALSGTLSKAAAWKSQNLADLNYFAHDDIYVPRTWDQRIHDCGYTYNTWIGENIAAGNSTAANTFLQWKNSAGHNANMLSPEYHVIGIARAYNASSTYDWYWTTDFGGYVDAPPGPVGTPTSTRTATRTPTRTATATPMATSTPKNPNGDTDGDGIKNSVDLDDDNDSCQDTIELATGHDPHDFWDFFDVWTRTSPTAPWTRDGTINIPGDFSATSDRFGATHTGAVTVNDALAPPPNATGYHASYDRGPGLAPPDGAITVFDFLAMAGEFGYSC